MAAVRLETGYNPENHAEEIRFAYWILENLGGDILLLKEKQSGQRTADYMWNGKLWELKSITSSKYNTIDQHIRDGYKQIKERPGGIFLDISGSRLNIIEAEEMVTRSMRLRKISEIEIIIRKGAEYSRMGAAARLNTKQANALLK